MLQKEGAVGAKEVDLGFELLSNGHRLTESINSIFIF